MVSIIKNQLLKHLSRFTKNLSADKINLSTFKGEGELTNLELNETVLTDLLELPSWLKLTEAWCNKVTFRIAWTKLKSVPIHLSLDEVNITVETCEELRSMSAQGTLSSYAPGKYSFIHKVIDGITVTVNTVNVLFNSPAFTASVQLSRIVVESKTPKWTKSDLRMTRLKDPQKNQLLIFKELEWQTVRIEAKSTIDKNLTPLRLLTNQAKCRIVIKKRLSDCFILGSRIVLVLDDLLWVLTDSQLKAALHFLDSLAGLIQKATQLTRKAKAARKLELLLPSEEAATKSSNNSSAGAGSASSKQSSIFNANDVVETSYHVLSNQIVLHLCDDAGSGRSHHHNLKDGGALQIAVKKFQVDFYPYHLAKGHRRHWAKYDVGCVHSMWQEQAMTMFKTRFLDLIERGGVKHTPLSRSPKVTTNRTSTSRLELDPSEQESTSPTTRTKEIKKRLENQLNKLMTTCLILRIEDFTLYKVTTSGKKQALKEFVAGDRDHISLPEQSSIVHAEFIYYYYPSEIPFPLPPPKFYVHLNPIQVIFDVDSCLWLNSFALNLYQSLIISKQQNVQKSQEIQNLTYIDVKIEAILPRINFESTIDYPAQRDRPKTLCFQTTRLTLTNVRSLDQSSRADLAKCVDSFHMGSLFFCGNEFPSESKDFYVVTQKFLDHISADDNIRNVPKEMNTTSLEALVEQFSRELLWTEAKDVWCINLEPVFADFFGAKAVGIGKSVPFLDNVQVTVWIHTNMDPNSTLSSNDGLNHNADIHALAYISHLVSVQLNHYQFLFLLRLAEEIQELMTFISMDTNRILKNESNTGSIVIGALLPQLEVTFVMPSQCPGKESSGGDVESFVPDSSSIQDEPNFLMMVGPNTGASTATVWQTSNLSIEKNDSKFSASATPNLKRSDKIANGNNFELSRSLSMDFPDDDLLLKNSANNPAKFMQNNALNAGFSSMRKGFSNLMSSIDSALKPSPEDSSNFDTISIKSECSSDSENYILISNMDSSTISGALGVDGQMAAIDLMFIVKEFSLEQQSGPVEMASEVMEDEISATITTTSEHSLTSGSCRRKDLISVSTFKLNKVEFLQQSIGYSSSIKIQIGNIMADDCLSIPWDEFQAKFTTRQRAWADNNISSTTNNPSSTSPKIKLRLDHVLNLPSNPSTSVLTQLDLKKLCHDQIVLKVSDLNLDLSMSTLTGLADLAEDEIISAPIPIEIYLDNIKLHLNEDRPPVNITSPGPIPIDLNISHMYIKRGEDGVFNIYPFNKGEESRKNSETTKMNESSKLTRQLTMDNDELRRRLTAFEKISEENCILRKAEEESSVLRSCLMAAQDEVGRLLEEKRRLLDEVRMLKEGGTGAGNSGSNNMAERSRQWMMSGGGNSKR